MAPVEGGAVRATRYWLRAPEVASANREYRHRHGTGSDVFPVDGGLHLLEIGLQAIQLSPYSAGPAAPHARTSGHGHRFPGMLWSPSPFRIQVSHQTHEPPSEFLPAIPGIQQGASRRSGSAAVRARRSGGPSWLGES